MITDGNPVEYYSAAAAFLFTLMNPFTITITVAFTLSATHWSIF